MESNDTEKPADKIDLDALRQLLALMDENDLVELEYECGDIAVRLGKRPSTAAPAVATGPAAAAAPTHAVGPAASPPPDAVAEEDAYLKVLSPMVGTFYAAPGPDTPAFVAVGDQVTEDTVVCLIEAMKVFNEIKAGVAGRIAKVCASSEDTVEYDQTLFLVEPA
jgi:acetyl-CoA carboxylase biotin carboxyl carrier protein